MFTDLHFRAKFGEAPSGWTGLIFKSVPLRELIESVEQRQNGRQLVLCRIHECLVRYMPLGCGFQDTRS
jgi:hypothetical protein